MEEEGQWRDGGGSLGGEGMDKEGGGGVGMENGRGILGDSGWRRNGG